MEPVHIMDNIVYVSTYQYGYTIAIGNDGSIWIWGKGVDLKSNNHGNCRTPYLLELDNLYYKDNETDWKLIGLWREEAWGIAGCPISYSVNSSKYSSLSTIISSQTYNSIEVGDFGIIPDYVSNVEDIFNLDTHADFYTYFDDEGNEYQEIRNDSIDLVSYEKFDFNDGKTGLVMKYRDYVLWLNGSAFMFSDSSLCNKDIVIKIAKTLCDRDRTNLNLINSINKKLAELESADSNNNNDGNENETETMSPEEQLMEQRMLLEQSSYEEYENEAVIILDTWLEQYPIYNQIELESANDFIDTDNGRYYKYYMLVDGGIYAMLYVDLNNGEMIIDSVEGGYDGGEMPLERWYYEYVVYDN
jgi:hypothetical protein